MSARVKILCLAGLALLVGVVGKFALSQVPQDKEAAQAAQLFSRALPHLEAVLGYPLPARPEFRILSLEEFKKIPGWETKAFLGWRFPALEGTARQNSWQLAHHAMCQATVARHVEGTNTIALVPGNLAGIAEWDASLKEVRSPTFLQLELVHAAARLALEKKHGLLDRKYDPHSLEELRINQALQEGRAQWLTEQVARRLGAEETFTLLAKRWLHAPDLAADPQIRAACQNCLQQKHWALVQGKAFFEHLESNGLGNVEQKVFAHPPRQVDWIEQPELYLSQTSVGPNLNTVLAALGQKHPLRDWKPMQQPWTPTMFKQVAGMVKEEVRAEKLTAGWVEGRSLIWVDPKSPGKYVALSVVRFDSGKGARAYYGFALDLQRKRDELSGQSATTPLRVLDSKFEPFDSPGLEEGVRNDKSLQALGSKSSLPVSILLGRSGTLVMELNFYGAAPDPNWARSVFQAVVSN